MIQRLFHWSFGFTKQGISANILVAPQIRKPEFERRQYGFLKNAYQGGAVFTDARLFLNMNPAQILAVRAGFALAVSAGDKYVLNNRSPAGLYLALLERANKTYEHELDRVDDAALGKGVNPFDRGNISLQARLDAVVAGSADITKKFEESLPGMELSVSDKSTGVYDPNCDARTKGAGNRRLYAKPIVSGLEQLYMKFVSTPASTIEMDKAEKAAR